MGDPVPAPAAAQSAPAVPPGPALLLPMDRDASASAPRPWEHAGAAYPAPLSVVLAACVGVLARHADCGDVRLRLRDHRGSPDGSACRTVALTVKLSDNPPLSLLARRIATALASPAPHPSPLEGVESRAGGGLAVELVVAVHAEWPRETDDSGLTLSVSQAGDGWRVGARHDGSAYTAEAGRRLLGHVGALLDAGLRAPATPVRALEMLTARERRTMLRAWNATATPLEHDQPLHTHIARQAQRDPEAVALVAHGLTLTRGEMDRRARQLAARLAARGVGPGSLVGLCMAATTDLLVAQLATLRAGAAYLPMDPEYPAERLALMRRLGGCDLILADGNPAERLPVAADGPLLVDALPDAREDAERAELDNAGPEDLCYVIFTSGSTGDPKGIEVRHRGVANNLLDINRRLGVGSADSVLAVSPPGFDMSVYETLGMAIAGGRVILPALAERKDPGRWVELLDTHAVTIWNSAPALLELVLAHARAGGRTLPALRAAMVGGDWIDTTLARRLRAVAPHARLIALGGATESSIHSTWHEVTEEHRHWPSVPYGRPMANQRAYILDQALQPTPIGVPGELFLAGVGLARGYRGRPDLTAERFISWSHGPVKHERLYRTGDLAVYHADGEIELLGRVDFQVKVNGVRVELGEVEHRLRAHPDVREAACVAAGGRLRGFVTPQPGRAPDPEQVRRHVAASLPAAMTPSTVVVREFLPLSPNGKIDRRALRDADVGCDDPPSLASAAGALEARVLRVWTSVLGTPCEDVDADFFALGGGSFDVMRVMAELAPGLPPMELLRHPTARALARRLRQQEDGVRAESRPPAPDIG